MIRALSEKKLPSSCHPTRSSTTFAGLERNFEAYYAAGPSPLRAGGLARHAVAGGEAQVTDIVPSVGDDSEKKQRRQMLVALALLLAALILVLIKDRDFWFPPDLAGTIGIRTGRRAFVRCEDAIRNGKHGYAAAAAVHARPKSKPHTPPPGRSIPVPRPHWRRS